MKQINQIVNLTKQDLRIVRNAMRSQLSEQLKNIEKNKSNLNYEKLDELTYTYNKINDLLFYHINELELNLTK